MPRQSVPIVGFSNTLASTNANSEQTINMIVEPVAGAGKVKSYLRDRPVLQTFAQVMDAPTSPANAPTSFEINGLAYVIIGTTFAEVFDDGTTIVRGTVTRSTTALPAQIVSNGTAGGQLLLISGGSGYVFTFATNGFVQITNANFPGTAFPDGSAGGIEFMDGYGIVFTVDSREFHISTLEDFTSWDPLDVAQRSEAADNFAALIRVGRQLMFVGWQTGEVWSDNGDALFPFAPIPGTFIEWGSPRCPAIVRYQDTCVWLGASTSGQTQVMRLSGYTPQVFSTPAVDLNLQTSGILATAGACLWTCQMDGHWWLGVTISDLRTTWIYDALSGGWVEWGLWNVDTARFDPFPIASHMNAFFLPLVTTTDSGVIYKLTFAAHADSTA